MVEHPDRQFVVFFLVLREFELERAVCTLLSVPSQAFISRPSLRSFVTVQDEDTVKVRVNSFCPLANHFDVFWRE